MTVNQNPQKAPEEALPAPGIPNLREAKKGRRRRGRHRRRRRPTRLWRKRDDAAYGALLFQRSTIPSSP